MKFNNIVYDPQLTDKKFPVKASDPEREAKLVVLQPVGYPFVCNLMESPRIDAVNKELLRSMQGTSGRVSVQLRVPIYLTRNCSLTMHSR